MLTYAGLIFTLSSCLFFSNAKTSFILSELHFSNFPEILLIKYLKQSILDLSFLICFKRYSNLSLWFDFISFNVLGQTLFKISSLIKPFDNLRISGIDDVELCVLFNVGANTSL